MQAVPCSATLVTRLYRVREEDLNMYRLLHGGRMLTLADETGFLSTRCLTQRPCLTRAVHQAGFHRPAGQGEMIEFAAWVVLTGQTSLWCAVTASCARYRKLFDGLFVYVLRNGEPHDLPQMQVENPEEKYWQDRARRLRTSLRPAQPPEPEAGEAQAP